MPYLTLKSDGRSVFVPDDRISSALASGLYNPPASDATVNVEVRPGVVGETTAEDLAALVASGVTPESETSFRERERGARLERERGGITGDIEAFGGKALDTVGFGGYSALARAVGGEEATEQIRDVREANPIATGLGMGAGIATSLLSGRPGALGALSRATPLGKVTQIGGRFAQAPKGAGIAEKFGRAAAGGTFEGASMGLGEGVEQLALSDDPLTLERVGSTLSSNMLYGAGIGAAAGSLAKAAEIGLSKTRSVLDGIAERASKRAGVADDLDGLDMKGLREAERAEIETLKGARGEIKAAVADELKAFRQQMADDKLWLATQGMDDVAFKKLGRRTLKADKSLDSMLDDPKGLAAKPEAALKALRVQEAALDEIVKKADDIRAAVQAKHATDDVMDALGGKAFVPERESIRLQKLDQIPAALERNRALQAKILGTTEDVASPRLTAIRDAQEGLKAGGGKKGIVEQMAGGSAFSAVTGAVASLPIPGAAFIAPFIGGKAAEMVGTRVFGRFAKSAAEASARTAKAVGAFLDVTKRVTPAAPVLATKVLSSLRYAPGDKPEPDRPKGKHTTQLAASFTERSKEIRSQVQLGVEGKPVMRPEARQALAAQLRPVGVARPDMADQLETLGARRLEFLARMLPKRPDRTGIQVGPDTWQPSDMEMRQFARYAAAVEDPIGIVERLGAGTVTPEDAEVMREVYPEMYADIQRQIIEALPTLRANLPYQKKLSLSIFSGIPVDPATSPGMLKVLQATFAAEPEGGMQAPMPQAQFGSVKAEKATPAQTRAG